MLSTKPYVRVYCDDHGWRIRDIAARRSVRTDKVTAAIAVALLIPANIEDIVQKFTDITAESMIRQRINALYSEGFLSEVDEVEGHAQLQELRSWSHYGWGEAHDYIKSTWSYSFEDYSRNGQEVDKYRMRKYANEMPDDVRALPQKGTEPIPLPSAIEALKNIEHEDYISDAADLRARLLNIAAAAALPTEWKRSRTPGADYMHRTSPSGGSRHPSELYLLSIDVPDLRQGAYHVAVKSGDLGFISMIPDEEILKQRLPGAYRLPARPRAIFVITTHFLRNMYRYREPRTLRTVYYDAGHLGGLIESLADFGGLIAQGHHGFEDSFLSELLRMEGPAVESASYLVSIGLESEVSFPIKRVGKSRLNR